MQKHRGIWLALLLALLAAAVLAPVAAMASEPQGIPIDTVHFPDATFRQYVKVNFDTNNDNVLSSDEIAERNRNPDYFDLDALSKASAGFSGAEIEAAVVAALYDCYYAGRDLEEGDVMLALAATVPLSRTLSEEIRKLRDWCLGRARPASTGAPEVPEGELRKIELE